MTVTPLEHLDIADPKGPFYAGVAIEGLIVAALIGLRVSLHPSRAMDAALAIWLAVAIGLGLLLVAVAAVRIRVTADPHGLRGGVGFTKIALPWDQVKQLLPDRGVLYVILIDGSTLTLRVPNMAARDAYDVLSAWQQGRRLRVVS